jgi:hypothetical protein
VRTLAQVTSLAFAAKVALDELPEFEKEWNITLPAGSHGAPVTSASTLRDGFVLPVSSGLAVLNCLLWSCRHDDAPIIRVVLCACQSS